MYLIAFIVLALLIAWRINHRRKRKARHADWLVENKREAQRLVAVGQMSVRDAQWRIRQGLPMPLFRYSSGGSFVPTPNHDADGGYAQEPSSSTTAFWEQMEEQRRNDAYRRREDEIEQHWRDDDNRRQAEARQRDDEYWAQRQRDNY